MTAWKTQIDDLIATIANGNANDQATKDAIAELKTKLEANEGVDSNADGRLKELEAADVEFQNVISSIVEKLQAGDIEGAKAVANEAQA